MQLSENNLFQSMRQPQSDWRSYQKNNNNNTIAFRMDERIIKLDQ